MDRLEQPLKAIRQSICSEFSINAEEARVYVWLLPPWFVKGQRRERSVVTTLAELLAILIDHPSMILAGTCRASEDQSTKRTWALRKGLIGKVIFRDKKVESIRHQDKLKKFVSWTPQEYKKNVDKEVRLGRSLEDVRALCNTLGSAVAVALFAPSRPTQIFGAVTFDTLASCQPDQATLARIEALLLVEAYGVLQAIALWGKYPHITKNLITHATGDTSTQDSPQSNDPQPKRAERVSETSPRPEGYIG